MASWTDILKPRGARLIYLSDPHFGVKFLNEIEIGFGLAFQFGDACRRLTL